MKLRFTASGIATPVVFGVTLFLCLLVSSDALGQAWPDYQASNATDQHDIIRGNGGYLSWYKLLLIVAVFIVWVRVADWINRDSVEMQDETRLSPHMMNPISLLLFLVGFLSVITVPFFFVGFPLYFLTSFLPLLVYVILRNGRVSDSEDKAFTGSWFGSAMKGNFYKERAARRKRSDSGPEIDFKAAGADDDDRRSNLIRARQSDQFGAVKQLVFDTIRKRAGTVLMDYSAESAIIRMEVDGFWHEVATMDRVSGDQMLFSLKSMAGLSPAERRAKQSGEFTAIIDMKKTPVRIMSQGVPNGERVTLKVAQEFASRMTPQQIGMWPEVAQATIESMNAPGIVVISGPASGGLSTTWTNMLGSSDRLTRDCVALLSADEQDTSMENIQRKEIVSGGKGKVDELESLLLRNPDVLILPEPVAPPEFMDVCIREVNMNERSCFLRVQANSAAEAILRAMQKVKDREGLLKGLTHLTCQRLVRRLCQNCKQPLQTNPQFLAQLGSKPGDEVNVCGPYQRPATPPVDEKGKPIEIPDCHVCGGLGYIGRIAVVEALKMDDTIRKTILTNPKLDVIANVAQKQGNLTMLQQGYRLVLAGVTSLQEIQRVFQKKK